MPVDALLRRTAARGIRTGRRSIFFGRKTSFAELDRAADRFAHVLAGEGVGKGDRVSLHLPTSPAFVIAFMGAMRAGAIAVPMNPLYVERELGVLFEQVKPKVSVTIDLLLPRLDKVRASRRRCQPGRYIIDRHPGLAAGARSSGSIRSRHGARAAGTRPSTPTPRRTSSACSPMRPPRASSRRLHPTDIAVLQPTGGTTGIPKCAMLTHRNLVANAHQVAAWFPSMADTASRRRSSAPCPSSTSTA